MRWSPLHVRSARGDHLSAPVAHAYPRRFIPHSVGRGTPPWGRPHRRDDPRNRVGARAADRRIRPGEIRRDDASSPSSTTRRSTPATAPSTRRCSTRSSLSAPIRPLNRSSPRTTRSVPGARDDQRPCARRLRARVAPRGLQRSATRVPQGSRKAPIGLALDRMHRAGRVHERPRSRARARPLARRDPLPAARAPRPPVRLSHGGRRGAPGRRRRARGRRRDRRRLRAVAHTEIAQYTINVCSLIGLGVAIDYSLFTVSRYREELAAGHDYPIALARAMRRRGAGRRFSGLAVGDRARAGSSSSRARTCTRWGSAAPSSSALAVVFALTFLPALLAVLGPRIHAGRCRFRTSSCARGSGITRRCGSCARPVAVLVPTLGHSGTPIRLEENQESRVMTKNEKPKF